MNLIAKLLLSALSIYIFAWFLPGVTISNYKTAIIVTLLIAVVDTFVKPALRLLTFPITFITLGLSLLIINACLILFIDYLVSGFAVSSIWMAMIFAILCSLFSIGQGLFGSDS
jgi:putative membrane protein